MKITFPVDKLRDFVDRSDVIKMSDKNDVLTVLKSIRFEIDFGICTITKANNNSFFEMSFPIQSDESTTFLLEDKNLKNFIDTTERELCVITFYSSNKVGISDGKFKLDLSLSSYNAEEYPYLPKVPKNGTRIEKHVIDWLKIARNYVSKDTLRPAFTAVYLIGHEMFATDAFRVFYRNFTDSLPTIYISGQECDFLVNLPYAEYCNIESESWNVYKCGNLIYGFRKIDELKPFDYKPFVNSVTRASYVKVQKSDILKFCRSAISFLTRDDKKGGTFQYCDLSIVGSQMLLKAVDKERGGEENTMTSEIEKVGDDFSFKFPAEPWRDTLQTIPYDEICISEEKNFIGIWSNEDASFLGLVAKYKDQ